jgi:hypothetical protein
MALEEVTTEVEVEDPKKKKKKLASMKKEPTMDTELRENVPVSKVLREAREFSNIMAENERKTKLEIAANQKIRAMKAGKAMNQIKEGVTGIAKDMGKAALSGLNKAKETASDVASRFSKPSNNIGHKYKNLEGGEMKVLSNKKKLM